jgi:hypothetical protein
MAWWDTLAKVGGAVAAPFTGGMSLLPALAIGGGSAAAGYFAGRGKGGDQGKGVSDAAGGLDEEAQQLLKGNVERMRGEGTQLRQQGAEALSPVLEYFKQLMGGDPAAMAQATAPERGKVIDQYDAARQSIARFAPRGGGSGSAIAGSYVQQAQQLGDITSRAREGATAGLAQLGPQLQALGLNADQVASMDLNTLIQSVLSGEQLDVTKRGQTFGMWGDIGTGVGSLLGQWLGRGSGAAA